MSQSISKPAEKTLSRKCWKQLSRVEYPKIVQIILPLPSDWLVMLIKGVSFHVKVRRMGKAREKRKFWAIRDGGALKPLGGTQQHKQEWAGFTDNELCFLRGPWRCSVSKGLGFNYLNVQISENAVDYYILCSRLYELCSCRVEYVMSVQNLRVGAVVTWPPV